MLAMVEEHLQAIRDARSDADILAALRKIARRFGFRSAYVIEYAGPSKKSEHILDTDETRAQAWAAYFNGPLHDTARVSRTLASLDVVVISEPSFSGPDDPMYAFCKQHDLVDSTIVPIHHAGDVVGVVELSGARSLGRADQIALQLVAYNLFAQTRSFRNVGIRAPGALTPREKEVMRLAADGLTSQDIAERLGMSPRTVNQHVDNVADKLGTKNRTHTVAEVIRHELLN